MRITTQPHRGPPAAHRNPFSPFAQSTNCKVYFHQYVLCVLEWYTKKDHSKVTFEFLLTEMSLRFKKFHIPKLTKSNPSSKINVLENLL